MAELEMIDPDRVLAELREATAEFLDDPNPWESAMDASEAGLHLASLFRTLDTWITAGGIGLFDWPLM
jgi:hypothetical protein